MRNPDSPVPVGVVVMVGLGSLAAAMGVGRFALTPLLPLMQEAFGISAVTRYDVTVQSTGALQAFAGIGVEQPRAR